MRRVLIVDDHPAVREGLTRMLLVEPGVRLVGAAATAREALDLVPSQSPEVVIVDYDLPDDNGLVLCCDLKALPQPPAIILYSAFTRPRMIPVATIAGLDAMVAKGAPGPELLAAIHETAEDGTQLPPAPIEAIEQCVDQLAPDQIPLFGMALNGTPCADIAAVIGDGERVVRGRLRALVGHLTRADNGSGETSASLFSARPGR